MTAKFYLHMKTLSRAKGARATQAAAYRAGERIRDRRMSTVDDYSDRDDVAHKEIVLPAQWDGCAELNWARDRETLWNAAEAAGKRRDARVGREVLLFLPPELKPDQRVDLVRRFARELAEKYRGAVDATIHRPRPGADERHHHAHLLMTAREVTPEGLGRRTDIELGGAARAARGLGGYIGDEYVWVRKRCAELTNEALREAGFTVQVDHRSLRAQGIDREPTVPIPQKIYYAELKSGMPTPAGNEIRARYQERVEARLNGPDELARVVQRQKEENRQKKLQYTQRSAPKKKSWAAMTREERNARARQWSHANRKEVNRKRRESYNRHAVAVNERRRALRKVDGERIRAHERELYRLKAEKKRRALGLDKQPVLERRERPKKIPAPTLAAAHAPVAARVPAAAPAPAPAPAPRESVAAWVEFRKRQSVVAGHDDPVADWKAFRAREGQEGAADNSIAKWRSFRELQPKQATADDSIAKWKAFRERQGPQETAQDSIVKWKEVRERELQAQEARGEANERSRGAGPSGKADEDEDEDQRRKRIRSRDDDFEL